MGFNGSEFRENLAAITGQTMQLAFPGMRDAFRAIEEAAVEAIHVRAKEQELEDLFKGMRGEGGVLLGGRQRRNGSSEYAELDALSSRNGILNDVILQSTMDALDEIRRIDAEIEQIWEERFDLAEKYLDAETLQRRDGETEEEYRERITQALVEHKDKMDPSDAAALDSSLEQERYWLDRRAEQVEQLRQRNEQYDLVNALVVREEQLRAVVSESVLRLEANYRLQQRVNDLRSKGSSEIESAVEDILEERSDLDIEIPENASAQDTLNIIQAAINDQTTIVETLKAESEVSLADVERAREQLTVALPETQVSENEARFGAEVAVDVRDTKALVGGFNLALNADEPLDNKSEEPLTQVDDTLTADLDFNRGFS